MEPYSRFTQRGAGLPFRGASVQDFISTAQDFDLARFSRSTRVSSRTPEALKTQVSNLTPAIFVEISIFLSIPYFPFPRCKANPPLGWFWLTPADELIKLLMCYSYPIFFPQFL